MWRRGNRGLWRLVVVPPTHIAALVLPLAIATLRWVRFVGTSRGPERRGRAALFTSGWARLGISVVTGFELTKPAWIDQKVPLVWTEKV